MKYGLEKLRITFFALGKLFTVQAELKQSRVAPIENVESSITEQESTESEELENGKID